MPGAGFEPARSKEPRGLSPLRLPLSPPGPHVHRKPQRRPVACRWGRAESAGPSCCVDHVQIGVRLRQHRPELPAQRIGIGTGASTGGNGALDHVRSDRNEGAASETDRNDDAAVRAAAEGPVPVTETRRASEARRADTVPTRRGGDQPAALGESDSRGSHGDSLPGAGDTHPERTGAQNQPETGTICRQNRETRTEREGVRAPQRHPGGAAFRGGVRGFPGRRRGNHVGF